jgi:hypothetical protein
VSWSHDYWTDVAEEEQAEKDLRKRQEAEREALSRRQRRMKGEANSESL